MFKLKNERNNTNKHKENKNSNRNKIKDEKETYQTHFSKQEMDEEHKASSVLRDAIKFNFFNKVVEKSNETDNKFTIKNKSQLHIPEKTTGQNYSNSSNKILPINNYNYPEDMMYLHHQINNVTNIDKKQITNNLNFEYLNKIENHSTNLQNTMNQLVKSENIPMNINNMHHVTINKSPNCEENFHNTNMNNTYPSLITPQLKNSLHKSPESNRIKQAINLEDLFIQEEKIWNILEAIRLNANISTVCDEYYDFQNMTSLQNLDGYFQKSDLKDQIRLSGTLEFYSIVCLSLLLLKNRADINSLFHSKNLMYYVHQNFSIIIQIIINKLATEFHDNMWVLILKRVLVARNSQHNHDLTFNFNSIKQGNSFIISMLKKFIYSYFKSKDELDLFSILEDVLLNITKYSHNSVRNIMFNIHHTLVQYKIMNQSSLNFALIPHPYLPSLPEDEKYTTYTLVLDLDETLVHYVNIGGSGQLLIRPGAEAFVEEMAKYYEVVVFTAAMQDYADSILDTIDPKKTLIKHRLYRHHASMNKNTYVKDISKLGRNLAKTIIIDNVWENFHLQSENGIFIKTWIGDDKDRSLPDLSPLLKDFVIKKVPDVRKALRRFRDTLFRLFINGDSNPYETVRKMLDSSNQN